MSTQEDPLHPAKAVQVGVDRLSIHDVVRVARDWQNVADLDHEVERRVEESAKWVKDRVDDIERKGREGKKVDAYYGVNTGFGAQAGKSALDSAYLTKVLMRNLIASHSVGVGEYFDEETVRAAMLIRSNTLAQGYSGVRPEIIRKLMVMLNQRVYPAVPSKGSLGASGDLAPLSHLALVMSKVPTAGPEDDDLDLDTTSGEAFVPLDSPEATSGSAKYHVTEHRITGTQTLWRRVSGEEAMVRAGGQVELLAKEGLALNNGATFSGAIAALTLHDARNLLENSELALSMTLEAIRGFRDPFFPEVHDVRRHRGAKDSAANVLRYGRESQLLDRADRYEGGEPKRIPPQDPYSVRCAPQVLGAVRDTLEFVQRIVEAELNAATDNPLIFMDLPRNYKTVSGGNFHGEPVGMALDFLGIAITELGNIAERRIFKLTDYHPKFQLSDEDDQNDEILKDYELPDMLIEEQAELVGLHSGFMLPQYTAAALVSDCKTLAHPDSVDSIPSSANQEDHVSMSLNAARHAREIVDNIESVIAIEFLCAAQALDLREKKWKGKKEFRLGLGTDAAWKRIREVVDYLDQDRVLYPDIRASLQLVRNGELVRLARQATEEESV